MLIRSDIADNIIKRALSEDIGPRDVTTQALFDCNKTVKAVITAKENFVVAGLPLVERVFSLIDGDVGLKRICDDGEKVLSGGSIAELEGDINAVLSGERLALNFLQRLSGIATLTRRFTDRVKGLPVRILDTRKTTPALRIFERYAVRTGGGFSHRFGLYDGILIKDNHIKACGGIKEAMIRMRENMPAGLKVEIEVKSIDELKEALRFLPDIVLLDNMDTADILKAVQLTRKKVLLEASGGVTLDNVREIAETGVDFISVGALTHSARSVDISMGVL